MSQSDHLSPANDNKPDPAFPDMIVERVRSWADIYDRGARERHGVGVTLTMRNRGDYFGYFFNRSQTSTWRPFTGKGQVTFPVIGRSIRSKTATACATRVQVQIEAVKQDPEQMAAAEIGRNVAKLAREKTWNKQIEASLAELGQLHRMAWLYTQYIADGPEVERQVTETKKVKSGVTSYDCRNCGLQVGPEDLGIDDPADAIAKMAGFSSNNTEAQSVENSPSASTKEQPSLDMDVPDEETDSNQVSTTEEPSARELSDRDSQQLGNTADGEFSGDWDIDEVESEAITQEAERMIEEQTAQIVCPNPECGLTGTMVLTSLAVYEEQEVLTGKTEKIRLGRLDTQVISPLLVRFDVYSCPGFQYRNAAWFNYHPLIPVYELEATAPWLKGKVSGNAAQWSEASRLHYDLSMAGPGFGGGAGFSNSHYPADELVEINIWWITPDACMGYIAPEDWELGDGYDGELFEKWPGAMPKWNIRAGETIAVAMERQLADSDDPIFRGLMVVTYDDHIIAISNPHPFDNWVGYGWKIDSQSGIPQGEENLLKLQDAATNVMSLVYAHVKKRAGSTLVADPQGGFNESDIRNANQPGSIIIRKPIDVAIADRNWQHYLGFLQPGELGSAVYSFIELIIQIAKEESGVFNETVGNVENTETLGGRKLALNQSLSLMTPTQQNKGAAMVETTYVWLELWQKHAPDEAYNHIKGSFEEEWKPQDIQAFRDLDVRRDLNVTVVEGTDIPRTLTEMEQRYMAAVTLGMFDQNSPIPIQYRSQIVRGVLGIDMDIENYDANKRLCASRYRRMRDELAALTPTEAITVEPDPMTALPVRVLRPEIKASLLSDARTAPRMTDSHLVMIEYWTDQVHGLAAMDEPNEPLIMAIDLMIDAHRQMIAATGAIDNAAAGAVNAAGRSIANPPMLNPPTKGPDEAQTNLDRSTAA